MRYLVWLGCCLPEKNTVPHFFTIIKQHGALLAKGWLLGLQFDTLFTDHLYQEIGRPAIEAADRIREALKAHHYQLFFPTPTNQIFVVMPNPVLPELAKKVAYGFWEKYDENHTVIRFATSWATRTEDTEALIAILQKLKH